MTVQAGPQIIRKAGICGGDAIVRGTRIPVWGLEDARRHGASDGEILRMYPSLSADDLRAAWAYVDANRDEIDGAIRENTEA